MSKSKGNVIDPIQIGEEYGTDAMRMAFIVGNVPGENMPFSEDKIRAYKKFANKLWNITRFILTETKETAKNKPKHTKEDKKQIDECNKIIQGITEDMENHRYHLASEKIYHYTWHTFADKILEESKETLAGPNNEKKESKEAMLRYIHATTLKVLHPFMPFVTETIWQHLPKGKNKQKDLLMIEQWPGTKIPFWKKLFT